MRLDTLKSAFRKPGPLKVFLLREPFPRLKFNGKPLLPRGTKNGVPDVVNVRRLPVIGSRMICPAGLKFGRSPPPPLPFESTPVTIVNGWPDCLVTMPEICQPPKIRFNAPLSLAKPSVG